MEIQDKMPWKEGKDWKKWLQNGDQYLSAATPRVEKSRFGPDLQYNLLSMSLEGYVMAIMDFHDALPENHTYTDLISSLETVAELDQGLKSRILKYENLQSICSIEKYYRSSPTEEELEDLRDAVATIGSMAHETCNVLS